MSHDHTQEKVLKNLPDYRIIDMHTTKSPAMIEKVVDLWRRNRILPAGTDPHQRAQQVVTAAVNMDDSVVGVVTVYEQTLSIPLKLAGKHVFVYRQFTQREDQRFDVMHSLSDEAVKLLDGTPGIDGILVLTENRKMMRDGFRRYFSRRGFELVDAPRIPEDVWFRDYLKLP